MPDAIQNRGQQDRSPQSRGDDRPSTQRAVVFTHSAHDVEVHRAGAWWPGSLLGWRHDDPTSCQVWVRVVVAGEEQTVWSDLADLRLPGSDDAPGGPSPAEVTATISMAAIRDAEPAAPGRHRAPDDDAADVPAAGAGRHRAADTGTLPAVRDEVSAGDPADPRGDDLLRGAFDDLEAQLLLARSDDLATTGGFPSPFRGSVPHPRSGD